MGKFLKAFKTDNTRGFRKAYKKIHQLDMESSFKSYEHRLFDKL